MLTLKYKHNIVVVKETKIIWQFHDKKMLVLVSIIIMACLATFAVIVMTEFQHAKDHSRLVIDTMSEREKWNTMNFTISEYGSLESIGFEYSSVPQYPKHGDTILLNFNFLNLQTASTQNHIDYELTVITPSGKHNSITSVCNVSNVCHTSDGTVSIPYVLNEDGIYSVVLSVHGVLFTPINAEKILIHIITSYPKDGESYTIMDITS